MNKVTTAALAGLMVVAAGTQASVSRWNGFGAAQAYIADVQDIFTLPGVVASHADTTYFELGTAFTNPDLGGCGGCFGSAPTNIGNPGAPFDVDASAYNHMAGDANSWGGVHGKLGGGVLGLWFNRPNMSLGNIGAGDPSLGFTIPNAGGVVTSAGTLATLATSPLNNQFEALYGFSLSDATTLGIGISRATNSTKVEVAPSGGTTGSNENAVGDFGISLGLEQKEVGPISLLEVGLQYNSRGLSAADKGTVTNKITGSGTGINLRVGGDMAGEGGKFSRVELGFNTQSLGFKDEFATAPAANSFIESKNSAMGWNLGYAMGGSNDKGMGLMGLMLSGLSQSRDEAYNANEIDKADVSTMRLLASTAGEAKVNSWLSLRAGLESDIFFSRSVATDLGTSGAHTKTTTTTDSHAGTVNDPNAKASMGVSVTLGDIVIDGVMNQDLLYTGPYLVSGVPGALASQVSLTWPWGGGKQ